MENFTQKWAIIALFEAIPEGAEFPFTDFPLHLTFAGVFAIEKDETWLVNELEQLLKAQQPFEVTAGDTAMFGENEDIKVRKINETQKLTDLHLKIHDWLMKNGAVYNSPQYQGSGYSPHSTFQKTAALEYGEKRIIDSMSLIDLFPHGDGLKRRIAKTVLF